MTDTGTHPEYEGEEPNVAYQLADYLRNAYVLANKYPEEARGFTPGDLDDLDAWRRHAHAVDLVRQVDDAIRGLEASGAKTAFYRRSLPKWYAGAYAVSMTFSRAVNVDREVCDEHALDVLSGLGERLNEVGAAAPVTDGQKTEVGRLLDELEELLRSSSSDMPADIRMYLWNLVVRARAVVSDLDTVGVDEARRTMAELGGALVAQAARDAQTGKPSRANKLGQLAWLVLAAFLGQAGNEAWELTADVVRALTESGGGEEG